MLREATVTLTLVVQTGQTRPPITLATALRWLLLSARCRQLRLLLSLQLVTHGRFCTDGSACQRILLSLLCYCYSLLPCVSFWSLSFHCVLSLPRKEMLFSKFRVSGNFTMAVESQPLSLQLFSAIGSRPTRWRSSSEYLSPRLVTLV